MKEPKVMEDDLETYSDTIAGDEIFVFLAVLVLVVAFFTGYIIGRAL